MTPIRATKMVSAVYLVILLLFVQQAHPYRFLRGKKKEAKKSRKLYSGDHQKQQHNANAYGKNAVADGFGNENGLGNGNGVGNAKGVGKGLAIGQKEGKGQAKGKPSKFYGTTGNGDAARTPSPLPFIPPSMKPTPPPSPPPTPPPSPPPTPPPSPPPTPPPSPPPTPPPSPPPTPPPSPPPTPPPSPPPTPPPSPRPTDDIIVAVPAYRCTIFGEGSVRKDQCDSLTNCYTPEDGIDPSKCRDDEECVYAQACVIPMP